jgi:flagellar motor switch/type III secretory pathway protein FliN
MIAVRPYPYHQLPRISRRAVRISNDLRRIIRDRRFVERVTTALFELLSSPTEIDSVSIVLTPNQPASQAPRLAIDFGPAMGCFVLEVDPQLVVQTITPFIERPPGLQNPFESLDASLLGAFAAIVASVLEAAIPEVPFAISEATLPRVSTSARASVDRVELTGVVRVAGIAHRASLSIPISPAISSSETVTSNLSVWGTLPLSVPLVVGCMTGMAEELVRLRVGAVWLVGDGLWIGREMAGLAVLAPPTSQVGWGASLVGQGGIVLGEGTVTLPGFDEHSTTADEANETLSDVIAKTPIIVRIELGSVTLPAEEWGQLGPGDTLQTRIPLGRPVELRVAGQIVARGDLVDVDGELGVQIRQLGGGISR